MLGLLSAIISKFRDNRNFRHWSGSSLFSTKRRFWAVSPPVNIFFQFLRLKNHPNTETNGVGLLSAIRISVSPSRTTATHQEVHFFTPKVDFGGCSVVLEAIFGWSKKFLGVIQCLKLFNNSITNLGVHG